MEDKMFQPANHSVSSVPTENRAVSIKEAFETLKKDYSPLKVIEFMDIVKSKNLNEVLENAKFIFSEPTVGHKFISNVIKTCEIPTEKLVYLQEKMNHFYNNALKGGYNNKEHLESIKESLNYLDQILIDKDTEKYIANETIYEIYKQYLPRQTLTGNSVSDELDIIVFNIGESPSIVIPYAKGLEEIRCADDFLRNDPSAIIIKNTSVVLNIPNNLKDEYKNHIEKLINLPVKIADMFHEAENEKYCNNATIESVKAVMKVQLQRIDIALGQGVGVVEFLNQYAEKLKEAIGKLCELSEKKLQVMKEGFDGLIASFAADGIYEDLFPDELDEYDNLDEEDEDIGEEIEDCEDDDEEEENKIDFRLMEQSFAIQFVKAFFNDNEEINLEAFNKMIDIANLYELVLEAAEKKKSLILHSLNLRRYNFTPGQWLIYLLLTDPINFYMTYTAFAKDKNGSSFYKEVNKVYYEFKKECKKAKTKEEIGKKIAECDKLISKLESGKEKIAQKVGPDSMGRIKEGSIPYKFRMNAINTTLIKLKNLRIDLKKKLETVKESFEPDINISFDDIDAMYDDKIFEAEIIRKAAIAADKGTRKIIHGIRRKNLNRKRITAIAKRVPQRIDRMTDTVINSLVKLDREERRKRIIEGGYKLRLFKLIRKAAMTGALAFIHPAIAAVGLIASIARDRKLDKRVRMRIVDELEAELTIVNEKIEDAKAANDRQKKYQLMRLKNKLERDIVRIRYNIKDMEENL